ncbi:MAG: LamG domain-containing protein [Opitutaceae bacterium]|nr:LamG domain-containing protein [Opitutaceae bacterium]
MLPISVLVSFVAVFAARAAVPAPIYEENFNMRHDRVRLVNGAALGGPGTGVSGMLGDRAYMGAPRSTEQEPNSPVAYAIAPIADRELGAFTCAFWYFLDEQTPDLQVLAETAGAGFFLHRNGFEIRLAGNSPEIRTRIFATGSRGTWCDWTASGRWIFVAFTWRQEQNRMEVYQGTFDGAVTLVREMRRDVPTSPLGVRDSVISRPETLGNTYTPKHDRPLAGRMDNFRFYDRVLDQAQVERLRLADVGNRPVSPE